METLPEKFSQKPITGSFGLAISLLFAVAICQGHSAPLIASTISVGQLRQNQRWESHTYQMIIHLKDFEQGLIDAKNQHKNYLLTRDKTHLLGYQQAKQKVDHSFASLQKLIKDNPLQQARLEQIQPIYQQIFTNLNVSIKSSTNIANTSNILRQTLNQNQHLYHQVSTVRQNIIVAEQQLLTKRTHRTSQNTSIINLLTLTGYCLGLIIVLLIYWRLRKQIQVNQQLTEIRIELEQEAAKIKLADFLESTTDAFVALDHKWCYTYVNQRAADLFQRQPADLIGKNIWSEFPEGIDQKFYHAYHQAMQDQKIISLEEFYPPWGRWFENRIYPSPTGLSIFFQDITVRKQAELALQATKDKLEIMVAESTAALQSSNQALEQFAYIASHDLQEPLRSIIAYSQLLNTEYQSTLDPTAQEYLEFIIDGSQRMQQLIKGLLAYSRLETQGKAFRLIDSQGILFAAMRNLQQSIIETQAQIIYDTLPTIQGDYTQILQLFQNLLSNALKYRRSEPPQIRIGTLSPFDISLPNFVNSHPKIHENWEENKYLFWIQDNGIGIKPQYTERIFDIFRRLHTRRKYPGTGIGLAICKKIVERHGGKIWADSEFGIGSIFYFTIPIVTVNTSTGSTSQN